MVCRFGSLVVPVPLVLSAQPEVKDRYVGSQTCGKCDANAVCWTVRVRASRSLFPAAEHPLADAFVPDGALLRPPNFRFHFRLNPQGFQAWASDDKDVIDIPIEWAIGAGDQAVTFVTRVNEDWYLEYCFS